MLAYVFGGLLGLGLLLSSLIDYRNKNKVVSFAAGLLIAHLFLQLYPLLLRENKYIEELVFFFVLLGFLLFFLLGKFVYSHPKTRIIAKEIGLFHAFGIFLYYLLIGMGLTTLLNLSLISGILFFIPIFLYSIFGEISLFHVHPDFKEGLFVKLLFFSSGLIGVIAAKLVFISFLISFCVLGFLIGCSTFLAVKEHAKESEHYVLLFFSGVALYTFLIFLFLII